MKPPRKDAFTELYRELDRETLATQGQTYLTGRADVRAKRARRWLWLIAGTVIGGAIVLGAAFAAWLLVTARAAGTSFSAARADATRAYTSDDP
jgi:hypothetical protein